MSLISPVKKLGNVNAIIQQALAASSWRVVVKRPAKAPSLEGPRPHHAISGKTVRFDVYMVGEC